MKKSKPIAYEPTLDREHELLAGGSKAIAGVDEAGRGPLAGPVTAAAVILPSEIEPHILAGIRDSKQLTEAVRERLFNLIVQVAADYSIAEASAREIETLNIRQASLLAMKRAVDGLKTIPDYVLVDGRDYPGLSIEGEAIIKGDQRSITIGAASILAKVSRDRVMVEMHRTYPRYGLNLHKGYPTKFHKTAVKLFGSCSEHRCTYTGVKEHLLVPELSRTFNAFLTRIDRSQSEEHVAAIVNDLANSGLISDELYYLTQTAKVRRDEIKLKLRETHPSSTDRGAMQESRAIAFLEEKGYQLWERNYRGREGEIDLIVNRDRLVVFVEVKARSSVRFGQPYEAVTPRKRRAIIRTADQYLYERNLLEGWDVRYDVISITTARGQDPTIEHYEDAFRVEGELD